jgi:hypothetical protein
MAKKHNVAKSVNNKSSKSLYDRPHSLRVDMSGAMVVVLDNLARRSELSIPDLIRFACSQYIESVSDLETV